MMKKILYFSFLWTLTGVSYGSVNAQETGNTGGYSPIFITPYKQNENTYTNTVPSMVQAEPSNRSTSRRTASQQSSSGYSLNNDRYKSNYEFKPISNPYAGTAFGRIRNEKEYFDSTSGRYVNQYEYMRLLSSRGETAKLNQVRSYLQQNGVFNPQKYQSVMNGGSGNQGQAGTQQGVAGIAPATGSVSVINRSKATVKEQEGLAVPQKLHQGYDDEPTQYKKNAPIFLR